MANETAISIDGKRFEFWERVRAEIHFDSMSTIEFDAPFSADSKDFRNTFRPFSFKNLDVTVDDDPLFTGFLVPITPDISPERKVVNVGGYALPGVLNDCTQGAAALPFSYRDQDLEQIIKQVIEPFGLSLEFEATPGKAFDKVKSTPTERVLPFIMGLAKQRGITISNNAVGAVLCREELSAGVPVAILKQGLSPLTNIKPVFDPQQYYSDITGIKPIRPKSKKSIQYTTKNILLEDVIRPFIFDVKDVKNADLQKAVEAKVGRMFGNMVHYVASVSTWRDNLNVLWTPNTLVRVTAPDAMIYNPYTFFIRSVSLFKDADSETAVLNLVLPGSFKGKMPEALPWD